MPLASLSVDSWASPTPNAPLPVAVLTNPQGSVNQIVTKIGTGARRVYGAVLARVRR
ncbi:hypothetical protein V6Z11_A03G132400 [Gossypium hirsutum]